MKYLSPQKFSVPVASEKVSQEDWDAIFAPKCVRCGRPIEDQVWPDKSPELCWWCFGKEQE